MSNGGDQTGLVLSAGGLYCAWQAGVYKALAPKIRIDLIAGASGGALNGWPIAGGCTPDDLISRWLDPDTSDLLRLLPNPGLTRGFFGADLLRAQTERIVREFQPRIPFGVALVELPRFRTVTMTYPNVTALHLQASCAIPVVLPAIRINGVRYVDGGILEKAPIHGALEMGATRLIVLDALRESSVWWLRLAVKVARAFGRSQKIPAGVEVVRLSPSEPLGDVNSAVFWKRENIERWIDLGYRDGCQALAQLSQFPESGTSK